MTERQWIYTAALVLAAGVLIHLLAAVLIPFLVALLLAYIGSPVVAAAARIGVPRTTSVLVLFLLFALLVLVLVLGLLPSVEAQAARFAGHIPSYFQWLQQRLADLKAGRFASELHAVQSSVLSQWEDVGLWMGKAVAFATHSSLRVAAWLLDLTLIPVLTFYLLRDWPVLLERADRLIPAARRPRLRLLAREIDRVLAGFLRGQLSVLFALAIYYALGLWLIGLDLALPIAVLAAIVSVVPYLGFMTGLAAASIAALLQFHGGWLHLAWVGGVFLLGHFLDSLFLTPRLVGQSIGMHPVVVIFMVMAGGQLFGLMGVLLALPVSATVMVWMRHLYYGDGDA